MNAVCTKKKKGVIYDFLRCDHCFQHSEIIACELNFSLYTTAIISIWKSCKENIITIPIATIRMRLFIYKYIIHVGHLFFNVMCTASSMKKRNKQINSSTFLNDVNKCLLYCSWTCSIFQIGLMQIRSDYYLFLIDFSETSTHFVSFLLSANTWNFEEIKQIYNAIAK